MKDVLIIYFSQTGQLLKVVDSIAFPLEEAADIHVDRRELRPQSDYPFPWPFFDFFDQFPEAVHLDPPVLQPLSLPEERRYDLVILAYTVWYLSPCPPMVAFLRSPAGREVLRDVPVITVIACRNMWLQAQEQTKLLLQAVGAHLIDNIVLTDRGSTLKTLVTTPRWMFTGRREPFWGIFPRAGITEEDITAAARFGRAITQVLRAGLPADHGPVLTGLRAAVVDQRLIASEKIGRRSFLIWGKLLRAVGRQGDPRRKPVIVIYSLFLFLMLATVVPITIALRTLLRPLRRREVAQQSRYFEEPSGSADFRMEEFS